MQKSIGSFSRKKVPHAPKRSRKKFSISSVVCVIFFLLIVEEGGVDLEEALKDGAVLEGLERRHVRPVVDADAPHTD